MSISKHKRKLILLYLNLVVTAATLVSFSYTTMAWFVQKRTATIIMQSVTVAVPKFVITDYKTYGVKTLTKNATTTDITFANDVVHSLPMYDPLSFAYNKYKKAVVVHITYTYTGTVTNNFSATTFYPTFSTGTPGAGANDLNYTSNCLQISKSNGTTLTTGWTQATLSYTNSDSKTFVTLGTPPTKTGNLFLFNIVPGSYQCWFVLEYNQAIMNYITTTRTPNAKNVIYQDDIVYRVA